MNYQKYDYMKREKVFTIDQHGCDVSISNMFDLVNMWMRTIGSGTWVLKLEKKPVQRSISQNALMWVWFDAIAQEWSEATDRCYTKESVKDMFTAKYLPVTMPDGSVVGRGTSGLSSEEMAEFLTKVQAYAQTEWGISLLSPEDMMFNEWRNQYVQNRGIEQWQLDGVTARRLEVRILLPQQK